MSSKNPEISKRQKMNDLLKELYQEIILDHGQEPRNFGTCENHNKIGRIREERYK